MKRVAKDSGTFQQSNSLARDNHVTGVEVEDVEWKMKDGTIFMETVPGTQKNN